MEEFVYRPQYDTSVIQGVYWGLDLNKNLYIEEGLLYRDIDKIERMIQPDDSYFQKLQETKDLILCESFCNSDNNERLKNLKSSYFFQLHQLQYEFYRRNTNFLLKYLENNYPEQKEVKNMYYMVNETKYINISQVNSIYMEENRFMADKEIILTIEDFEGESYDPLKVLAVIVSSFASGYNKILTKQSLLQDCLNREAIKKEVPLLEFIG